MVWSYCNNCHACRWHEQIYEHHFRGTVPWEDGSEEDSPEGNPWEDVWQLLQCRGCDCASVRRAFHMLDFEPDPIEYYPRRLFRRRARWLADLPKQIGEMVSEVYSALSSGSPRLALMGIRAVLDLVIAEKVGDRGTFGEKLGHLESEGYVGSRQREFLFSVIDAGSAASHRGLVADDAALEKAMDITENLLHSVYVLQGAAEDLRRKTPKRKSVRRQPPGKS